MVELIGGGSVINGATPSSFYLFTPLKHLFAPISQSPMSKLFRNSESLGKSNGKKLSQIVRLLHLNDVRLQRAIFFIWQFFPYPQDFLVLVPVSASVERCFVSRLLDFLCVMCHMSQLHAICYNIYKNINHVSNQICFFTEGGWNLPSVQYY